MQNIYDYTVEDISNIIESKFDDFEIKFVDFDALYTKAIGKAPSSPGINKIDNADEDILSITKPKDKEDLKNIIEERIKNEGTDCDLNDIDVSAITDMSELFKYTDFCGDISKWNTSKVMYMDSMFEGCTNFNCDLSKWDVSNVKKMNSMFYKCEKFNSDLSKWDVSNVKKMNSMFYKCVDFNSDLSNWDTSNVTNMRGMFLGCKNFNCDLSGWNVSKVNDMYAMFKFSKIDSNPPSWYKK